MVPIFYRSEKNIPAMHVIRLIQRNTKEPALGTQQVVVTNKHFCIGILYKMHSTTQIARLPPLTRDSLISRELQRERNEFLPFDPLTRYSNRDKTVLTTSRPTF